ncbi:helix-turn-helix transcriptional regulator [Pseudonocardia acaciae]|uniref:helix-turn-helix transcriptional regulator n=1 Tax=Pseudonocardia acaciae TaxID=551276 RepID=UPI00055BA07D|nr:LuxR C-terminal-related transcriptional regulator [Pseudonocardia acaciae]
MVAAGTNVDALLEIGALLGSSAAEEPGAPDEVLRLIHRVVPYAAASLSVFDPVEGGHRTIARAGYSDRVVDHLDTWFIANDAAYHYMRTVNQTPLRWSDAPFEYRYMYSAREVFLPDGYREGVTICMHTRGDHRYTGNLHLSTDEARFPGDITDMVRLQKLLGGFGDLLRPALRALLAAGAGVHAAIVTEDASVTPVAGRDPGPHLEPGRALVTAVANAVRRGELPSRFRWVDGEGGWHRIDTTTVGGGVLVIERECPLPCGLSARELDVLTALCAGRSNPEIAAGLFVSTKTVAKHVEHVLEKLGCTSRTSAAVLAVTHGLVTLG